MVGPYLLLVGCVAVVSGQTYYGQSNCNVAIWGNPDSNAWQVTDVPATLSPGIRDWQIPATPECSYHIGTVLTVCDYDVAPEANFVGETVAVVRRAGGLAGEGSTQLTYYCTGNK